MNWPKTTLGECVDLIAGAAFKSKIFTDDAADIPLVKGENIGQGEILWSESKYWPEEQAHEFERFKLRVGDVILAMDRPWVTAGLKYAWIKPGDPEALLVQRVARMRGANGMRTDFLRYVVGSKPFCDYIKAIMGGTNVPHISGDQIRAFRCRVPDLDTQDRIVEVLRAYDDLISNNRRRVGLLEESARLLFREWFVRLRYPGHEHIKVVDGIPEGWSAPSFTELAEFINGFAFKPHHWEEVGLPIVKIPELKEGVRQGTPRYSGSDVPEKLLVHFGDLLFSWSGTFAIEFWADEDAYLNQHLFLVKPYGNPGAAFLLLALREALPKFANLSVGATMKHIRRSALEQTRVLIPGSALLSEFEEMVETIYSLVVNIRRQNTELARARGLLLARLMGGRISI